MGQKNKTNMLILILGLSILVISSFTKKAKSLKMNEVKWSVIGVIGFLLSLAISFFMGTILKINWISDCQKFIATENQAIASDGDL